MNYLIKELRRHSGRTIISIIGYIIAALFFLLVLSVIRPNEKNSFGILKGTGTHFIIYIPTLINCCPSSDANGSAFAEGVNTQMMESGMLNTIKNIDGVKDVAPYLLYKMFNQRFKTDISIGGIDTTSIATRNNVCASANLIKGKFLSDRPDEIVAEESFAVAHGLSIGDTLDIFGGKMTLAGIINSGIKPAKADFYAPIVYVRAMLKDKLHCQATSFDMNIILVEVADARIQNLVINNIKNTMYKFSVSSYNCYEPAAKVMTIIEKTSGALSIMIFFFLIVFSTKTQLTSLMERFREIGILKSLGWSSFKLSRQILLNSLIQALIGVTIGCLLGILIILFMNSNNIRLFDLVSFQFQFSSIPALIILSLTGGVIASIFPIIKLYRTCAGDMINNYL
jgi:ABC-type antimicrobial peptide transport system permease subunit